MQAMSHFLRMDVYIFPIHNVSAIGRKSDGSAGLLALVLFGSSLITATCHDDGMIPVHQTMLNK